MPSKATAALIALLVFGSGSAVLADSPPSVISGDGSWAVTDAAGPFSAEEKASALRLAPARSAPFHRGSSQGRAMIWIRLTEPGGKLIHINVEQVTSVRSDTQIPGARAQLDLASGKFQGVQEDAEHVMRLISALAGAGENDEIAGAAAIR